LKSSVAHKDCNHLNKQDVITKSNTALNQIDEEEKISSLDNSENKDIDSSSTIVLIQSKDTNNNESDQIKETSNQAEDFAKILPQDYNLKSKVNKIDKNFDLYPI
jgi:hypothetical protein